MNNNLSKTKRLSLSGILLTLTIISLFMATIMPTNKVSFYVLSSFFVSIIIMEFGVKAGWIFYFTSCLLAFVIIPDKLRVIPFILFFGVYGVIKFHIEKINNIVIEYILKIIYFNLFLLGAFFIAKQLFFKDLAINLPLWGIVIALEIVFIIYDYVYTLFVRYYNDKLKKLLKI